MSKKGKTLALILSVLVFLLLAGGATYLLQQERIKNLSLQEKINDLETKQKIAETKLEEAQKSITDLGAKLQEADGKIQTLSSDLEGEKTAKQEALAQAEEFKADLGKQKELKSDLETKLAKNQEDVQKIQGKLKALESEKLALEKKVQDLEAQAQQLQAKQTEEPSGQSQSEGVELGKVVVSPEAVAEKQQESSGSAQDGKILVINKDYDFAVINLGNKDGINIGDMFSVFHNNKLIGDVKVEKVHDSMSAAGFASKEMNGRVSEGDKVVRKK